MANRLRRAGFTLVELLIAMIISSILIALTTSVYSLFRTSLSTDQSRADISQNARIVADRLTREIRQTATIVTDFPADPGDNSVAQPGSILFEDTHAGDKSYRYYYLAGSVLKLDIRQYYFASDPSTRVYYNALDGSGNPPLSSVISTTDIADHVQGIAFYGDTNILMQITTTDSIHQTYVLTTTVYRRN